MPRRRYGRSWAPVVADRMQRRREFEELVVDALESLPAEFQAKLENVAIVVEDSPSEPLLGLYQGVPQTERGQDYFGVLPDKITIYRQPIEDRARSKEDLAREVRKTVLHEIAHHFGIDDDRLHELGWD